MKKEEHFETKRELDFLEEDLIGGGDQKTAGNEVNGMKVSR